MKSLIMRTVLLSAVLALAVPAWAQVATPAPNTPPVATKPVDPEKAKDIRRFLDLSGSGKAGEQAVGQMLQQFKTAMPKVPAEFWDEFAKETSTESIVESLVPVYDKYLSSEDLKAIIAFYESPAGKKLVASQPQIAQDSRVVGQKWGSDLAKKIHERLKEKGYLKAP